jgi:hypothetical protein
MKLEYFGKVNENGQLAIIHRKQFDSDLKHFAGKDVTIVVERKKKQRSLSQNAFHFAVVIPLLKDAFYNEGSIYTNVQVHEILKGLFLKVDEPIGNDGLFVTRIKSSTELTTSQWMDFNTQITIWAAEFFKVVIPAPLSQQEIELK